jgi:Tfp pilus assembly PilM family ATPase
MVRRSIGIDIGYKYISAVQMVRSAEQYHIEKTFTVQMRRSTDSPVSYLRQLFSRGGFDKHSNIAAALPNNRVFFRRLETDASGLNHNNEQSLPALKQEFPVQADDLVLQFLQYKTLESSHLVVAAANKNSLAELLDTYAGASIYPCLIEPAILSAYSTIKLNYPEITGSACIIAYIDKANLTIAVAENDGIVLVRSLPLASKESNSESDADQIASVLHKEALVTWNRLYGAGIDKETKIFIVPSCSINSDISSVLPQKLNCQAIIPDPCRIVKPSADCTGDATLTTAEGLAISLLTPEQASGINFLEAASFDADPVPAIKKNIVICAALAAAIVVLLIIGLFARLSSMEKKYAAIKDNMKDIFKKTLPEETAIVDPLAQLEQRLRPLQDDYKKFDPASAGTAKPLEILRDISLYTPAESNITVKNILLTGKSARLTGTSTSFKAIYNWQRQLKENSKFPAVDILDIGAAPAPLSRQEEAGVKFTIIISLDSSEKI